MSDTTTRETLENESVLVRWPLSTAGINCIQHTFVGLLNLRLDLDVAGILERCHHKNFYSILQPDFVLYYIRMTKRIAFLSDPIHNKI